MNHTVSEHKLTSGAKGLFVHVPGASVLNLVVRFNSGFQFGDRSFYETSHVMEHLIGCGSKKYPGANEFKIEVEKNGAYRNAYTNEEVNGYVMEFAAFELERLLDLLEEYLVRPIFPEEAVPTELSNVREELARLTTQHGAVCAMALMEKAYPDESLNYDTRIEQLANFTRERIVDHYRATHTAANARFYVAGDLGEASTALLARLEQLFGRLPKGERLKVRQEPGLGQAAPIVVQRDIKQIYYSLRSYSGELTWPQRNAALLLRVLLAGGYQSRVYGEARRRGLAYHVDAVGAAGPGESSMGFEGYVTAANIEPLFELMAGQYAAMRAGELSEDELTSAKNLLLGSSLRSYQTAGDLLGWYLGRYDREELVLDFTDYHEQLRQVTREQVQEVANLLVAPKAQGLSVLGEVTDAAAERYARALEPIWA